LDDAHLSQPGLVPTAPVLTSLQIIKHTLLVSYDKIFIMSC
jgi:hypothetical protein